MISLRKYCNIKATSLLESVLALTLISICLFVATMVYSAVFSRRTSIRYYNTQNKVNEVFYIKQIGHHSLTEYYDSGQWDIEEEALGGGAKLTIQFTDSSGVKTNKTFYILK